MSDPGSILMELKTETQTLHQRVETLTDVFHAAASPVSYRRLLERFIGIYQPLEARLAARREWASQIPPFDLEARRKVPLLRQDLRTLGVAERVVDSLPRCTDVPDLDAFPRAVGCLYVLEGATLGGRIVSRYLAHTIGIDRNHGGAFFHGYGAQVGSRWAETRRLIVCCASSVDAENVPSRQAAIVAAARDTFIAFERWLTVTSDQLAEEEQGQRLQAA